MRGMAGEKGVNLGNLATGVAANQVLINQSNQYQHGVQSQQHFNDFRTKHVSSGVDLAKEFNHLKVSHRKDDFTAGINHRMGESCGVQQIPWVPAHPFQQMPLTPAYSMYRPYIPGYPMQQMPMRPFNRMQQMPFMPVPMAPRRNVSVPIKTYVHTQPSSGCVPQQDLRENTENLDSLRPTADLKKRISRILAGADPKLKRSEFMKFLKELKNRSVAEKDKATKAKQKESWAEEFNRLAESKHWQQQDASTIPESPAEKAPSIYLISEQHKEYLNCEDPFAKGVQLLKTGKLTEAVKAFEACVQQDPKRSEAWRFLGQAHMENDNSSRAIAALTRCIKLNEMDLSALMQLTVGYTNDLNQQMGLDYLNRWIANHPRYKSCWGLFSQMKTANEHVKVLQCLELYKRALQMNTSDHEVHTALGVLHSLIGDYTKSITNFESAVEINPTDASLWNKLGASLANGGKFGEAILAYKQALKLKPNYVRALFNLGISFAGQDCHKDACQSYLAALTLNPEADNGWAQLKASLVLYSPNLIYLCKKKDANVFRPHFNF